MAVFGPHCGVWTLQSVGVTLQWGHRALRGSWAPDLTQAQWLECVGLAAPSYVGSQLRNQRSDLYPLQWKMDSPPLDSQEVPVNVV